MLPSLALCFWSFWSLCDILHLPSAQQTYRLQHYNVKFAAIRRKKKKTDIYCCQKQTTFLSFLYMIVRAEFISYTLYQDESVARHDHLWWELTLNPSIRKPRVVVELSVSLHCMYLVFSTACWARSWTVGASGSTATIFSYMSLRGWGRSRAISSSSSRYVLWRTVPHCLYCEHIDCIKGCLL